VPSAGPRDRLVSIRLRQTKQDADDVYNALTAETLAPMLFLLPLPRQRQLP
jgi:hypothetical protein